MRKGTKSYNPLEQMSEGECSQDHRDMTGAGYCFLTFIRPFVAELLGVMLFVFVGVTCLCKVPTGASRISTALAHAFTLFVMVAVTAKVRYNKNLAISRFRR